MEQNSSVDDTRQRDGFSHNRKLQVISYEFPVSAPESEAKPRPGEKTGKHLRCPFKHVCANYVVTYGARIGGNINSINAPLATHSERTIISSPFSLAR